MNLLRILVGALVLITFGLTFNQWQLQRTMEQFQARPATAADNTNTLGDMTQDPERRFSQSEARADRLEGKLAAANTQIAQLEQRLRQLEGGRSRQPVPEVPPMTLTEPEESFTNTSKRSWGPEQAVGQPDTFQAGDVSTAWAPLAQDGGEEWLKLEYERAVDVAEVRVRETYNPGAIAKVTAFLANGTELTLWEGVEPVSQAPVEMSFAVPTSVNAKSIKVYLDTKRVPGWNEIDAVAVIGRDGSTQWARHATASSTFAQPRTARGLERF
jgi:hypothetical protein